MPERPGFFERMFASGSGGGKPPEQGKSLPPKKDTEGYLQHPTDFLVREPSEEERKEARRKELSAWVASLEKKLSLPEGRIRAYALEVGGKTARQYEAELVKARFKVGNVAKEILEKAELAKERHEMDVVCLTVDDLGFPEGATNREIWERGEELGLDLCPPDVGPELRLSLNLHPMDEWIIVAMEAVVDSDGRPWAFDMGTSSGVRWLEANDGRPDGRWKPSRPFAFVRRKQQ